MIGQLPPYAVATPVFRFRALAMHAGRAALGGDREIALTCFAVARLAAGMLPPFMLTPGDAQARAAATKQWLSSLTLQGGARAAASSVIDGVIAGNRKSAGAALRHLAEVAKAKLDASSLNELNEAVAELLAT